MDWQTAWIVSEIIGGLVVLKLLLLFALGGDRVGLAIRVYWRTLRDPAFAAKVQPLLGGAPAGPTKPSGVPLRLLGLLQRDGRLLDFLMEDIDGASDDQVGHGVREIHTKCREALRKVMDVGPVLTQGEGDPVEVPSGFDPSAIRLVGNVTGQPPFRGTLRHSGWRVAQLRLAEPPSGQDEFVVQPAEVEL